MNQTIDLSTKTSTELKAIAYDLSRILNNFQNQLVQVNDQIALREQEEQKQGANKVPPPYDELKKQVKQRPVKV